MLYHCLCHKYICYVCALTYNWTCFVKNTADTKAVAWSRAEQHKVRGSICRDSQKRPDRLRTPLFDGHGSTFIRHRLAYHWPGCCAKIKDAWICNSTYTYAFMAYRRTTSSSFTIVTSAFQRSCAAYVRLIPGIFIQVCGPSMLWVVC